MSELTEKQRIFCKEYIIDFNGTRAAISAGYSKETAAVIAFENLRKPNIMTELSALMAQRNNRLEISADRVVNELAKIAFSNLDDVATWDDEGKLSIKTDSDISDIGLASLNGLHYTQTESKDGDVLTTNIKITRNDKLRALEMLARHTGAFNEDESNKGVINVTIGKPSE